MSQHLRAQLVVSATALLALFIGGCASGPDPLEKSNRAMDNVNNFVDRAVVRDVARAYEKNLPVSVRDGVNNFFNNLGYLNVILNDHLQGRFAQGWRNTERMAVNTTIGVLGIYDPATGMGRPRQRNDFGITLGKWGVAQGPYLVLPVFGPSSTRDVPALVVSWVTSPMYWLNPPLYVSIPMSVTSFVDQRARLQPQIELRDRAALDPYTFTRDVYLRYRAAQVGEAPPKTPEGNGATTQPASPTDNALQQDDESFYDAEPEPAGPAATDYIR